MACDCLCHSSNRGNQRACSHGGFLLEAFAWAQEAIKYDEPVSDHDPLEAAVACDGCRNVHCPALRTPPRVWRPVVLPAVQQGDGYSYWDGEGKE